MTEKQLIGLLNRSLNTLDKLTKMSHETLADQSQLISIYAETSYNNRSFICDLIKEKTRLEADVEHLEDRVSELEADIRDQDCFIAMQERIISDLKEKLNNNNQIEYLNDELPF